jgi:hypothetical protein
MKKLYLLLVMSAFAGVFISCRTTEENYREAYEAVKEKVDADSGIDGTIYEKIRKEAINSQTIVRGDTVPTMTVAVKCVDGLSTSGDVKQYNIAVAQFKQLFNAKSLMTRLRNNGYSGATVVVTAEPLYYVIAATVDSPEEAAGAYDKVRNDKTVYARTPYPLLLRPQRYPLQ